MANVSLSHSPPRGDRHKSARSLMGSAARGRKYNTRPQVAHHVLITRKRKKKKPGADPGVVRLVRLKPLKVR